MQDFGTKANDTAGPSGQLSAEEFNNLAVELENSVSRSGQSLNGLSTDQLATSLFLHGVKAESFQDSGLANAYVATPISGGGGVLLPTSYTNLAGAVITLKASNTNSGASTLNIGQTTGALIGTKPIRTAADVAIPANSIVAGKYFQVVYNSTLNGGGGAWELMPWAVPGRYIGTRVFTANGTYTETPGTVAVVARLVGGGGAGGGAVATIAGQYSVGGGGGSGGYTVGRLTSGFSGASIVIGAAGAAISGATGGSGGATSFAGLTAAGGLGGLAQGNGAAAVVAYGGGGATLGGTGNITNAGGATGGYGVFIPSGALFPIGGVGASSILGGGGFGSSALDGGPGIAPGAGGGGSSNTPSAAARAGGPGAAGILYIDEYA